MIKNGLILTAFSVVAAAMLSFTYLKTAPIIAAQQAAKSGTNVMGEVIPDMAGGFEQKGDSTFTYYVAYKDAGKSQIGGYVIIVQGKGYTKNVPIETMVGIDPNGKVVGIKIVNQQETPGLGDKVVEIKAGETDPWFTRQFIGKSAADNLAVVKDGGAIDAISGATISSRAVTNSIRNGLLALKAALSGEAFVAPEEPVEVPASEKPITMPADDVYASVLPGMAGGYEAHDKDSDFPYWVAYKDAGKKQVGGYLFIARKEGFGGMIETLVGVDAVGKIAGIKIIANPETPDYGGKMEEIRPNEKAPWFPKQFIGKSAQDDVKLKASGGKIDAIAGATISSEAFTKSVNEGLKRLKAVVSGEKYVAPVEEQKKEAEKPAAAAVEINPEDALEDVLPAMFGGYEAAEGDFRYWTAYRDPDKSEIGGYLFVASGEGFASTIKTLIAVDPDMTVVGAKLLFQEETEGWGSKLTEIKEGEKEPWFIAQFVDKKPTEIALTADGGKIDAITEATVTSTAVTKSIADGIVALKEKIKK